VFGHLTPMSLSFFRRMLPRRRTTEAEAVSAMVACGVDPDAVAWRVNADGSFVFGRKHPDDAGLTYEQAAGLTAWMERKRVQTWLIAWESRED